MRVKAPPGISCPMEHDPRKHITDDCDGVEVADSAYYRRMIGDGSLLGVFDEQLTEEGPEEAEGGEQ